MAGLFGAFGKDTAAIDRAGLLASINPLGIDEGSVLESKSGCIGVSAPRITSLRGPRCYESRGWTACFAGDYVDGDELPWESIIGSFRSGDLAAFPEMSGLFALVAFDGGRRVLYLVSDIYSFLPVFYWLGSEAAVVSTSIATFPRAGRFEFNPEWLYEYLFFSFPVGSTGLWKNVHRMPPASILRYDLRSSKHELTRYGRVFERSDRLIEGSHALAHAYEVFRDRMPRYFGTSGGFAHALSGGYDTRTVLAFLPPERERDVLTYTYGIDGSNDILESRMVARRLGLRHREIHFDDSYASRLPDLARETVWLAGGLENINRAYLVHVYRNITEGGQRRPFVLSGIGADALFRGHVPTPNGLSYDMERSIKLGRKSIDVEFFRRVFAARFDEVYDYIDRRLDWMTETYGPFGSVESYFAYEIYEGLPRYFNGEAMIAGQYTALRIPFIDPEIVRLACRIEYSVFMLWRFVNESWFKESYLQPYLMARNPKMARIKLQGLPLWAFTRRSETLYRLSRVAYKGPAKLRAVITGARKQGLENWQGWYETILKGELDRHLSPDSRVARYVSPDFIAAMRAEGNMHWLKIVATLDIVLELAENGWKRP